MHRPSDSMLGGVSTAPQVWQKWTSGTITSSRAQPHGSPPACAPPSTSTSKTGRGRELTASSHWHSHFRRRETRRQTLPGSERTSLAAAMSMNFFSAFFFSSSFWKLSGCHCSANFRYALMISCFLAFLKGGKINNYLRSVQHTATKS